MVNEACQWFVEVSSPNADEEGGEHAVRGEGSGLQHQKLVS